MNHGEKSVQRRRGINDDILGQEVFPPGVPGAGIQEPCAAGRHFQTVFLHKTEDFFQKSRLVGVVCIQDTKIVLLWNVSGKIPKVRIFLVRPVHLVKVRHNSLVLPGIHTKQFAGAVLGAVVQNMVLKILIGLV